MIDICYTKHDKPAFKRPLMEETWSLNAGGLCFCQRWRTNLDRPTFWKSSPIQFLKIYPHTDHSRIHRIWDFSWESNTFWIILITAWKSCIFANITEMCTKYLDIITLVTGRTLLITSAKFQERLTMELQESTTARHISCTRWPQPVLANQAIQMWITSTALTEANSILLCFYFFLF